MKSGLEYSTTYNLWPQYKRRHSLLATNSLFLFAPSVFLQSADICSIMYKKNNKNQNLL